MYSINVVNLQFYNCVNSLVNSSKDFDGLRLKKVFISTFQSFSCVENHLFITEFRFSSKKQILN